MTLISPPRVSLLGADRASLLDADYHEGAEIVLRSLDPRKSAERTGHCEQQAAAESTPDDGPLRRGFRHLW